MPWRANDGVTIDSPIWGRCELIGHVNRSILHFISRQHVQVHNHNQLLVRNCRYSRKYIRIQREGIPREIPPGSDLNWLGPFILQHGDVLQFLDRLGQITEFRFEDRKEELQELTKENSRRHSGTSQTLIKSAKNIDLVAEIVPLQHAVEFIQKAVETEQKAVIEPVSAPRVSLPQKHSQHMIDPVIGDSSPPLVDKPTDASCNEDGKPELVESPRKRVRFSEQPDISNHPGALPYMFYFVPKGTDMDSTYIEGSPTTKGLRQHVEERGIKTQHSFCKSTPPTHFIISDRLSDDNVVWECLDFASREVFIDYLTVHNITCVYRTWATRETIRPPRMMEKVLGFAPVVRSKSDTPQGLALHVNEGLSSLFRSLAKWYQECPLLDHDSFRSYTFTVIAGRVRRLGYEITKDRVAQLEATKGFGASTIRIIRDFIKSGTCERLDQLKQDKKRLAMRSMMRIWGVGQAKASELVTMGYARIGSVRKALKDSLLTLDRNQYIGVLNYEDFQEEMSRDEVESIAELIFAAVRNRYPKAEMEIMGSYRRGKETCGDVDVLITHPDYADRIPPQALGQVLDDLRSAGHISFHLTRVHGMKEALFETLPEHVTKRLTVPKRYFNAPSDKNHVSSWMGVFSSKSKNRRVDIKWYPHNERIFASLYFTGNGHFNRSMRLWAKRRFSYRLSDHGLFDTVQNRPAMPCPHKEKDVFDVLGLCWKEPHERDCFDAVETVDQTDIVFGMQMTKSEFMADNLAWVD